MEYVVQPGDTLSAIARRFGVPLAALLAVNPEIADPDLIFPGQVVRIPLMPPLRPPAGRCLYVIQPGDTLSAIAQRFNVDLTALIHANPQITNPDLIYPGQVIFVPLRPMKMPLPMHLPAEGHQDHVARPERPMGMDMGLAPGTEHPGELSLPELRELPEPPEFTELPELPEVPGLPSGLSEFELPRPHGRPIPSEHRRHHRR